MSAPYRLSPAEFVALVREIEPEVGPLIDEHLSDNDGLLIHLLMADLLRFAVARFGEGDTSASGRVVGVVGRALTEGDKTLVNAVAVSFVENVGAYPGETPEFIATWPASLLDELHAQFDYGRKP